MMTALDITHIDQEMDVRGLNCPLPILRTKKALSKLTSGQVIAVLTTDPHAERDFQAFCQQTGNPLLGQQTRDDGVWVHYIQRR